MKWWNWAEDKVKENMPLICSANIDELYTYWNDNKKDL
jgi:chloramphenicol O-acetyltransferase type B